MLNYFRIILCVLALGGAGAAVAADQPAQKAVLVTGASSGIGLNITKRLASNGYFVYAGARKDADLAALDEIDNVQAVRLDVTYPEHIEAAIETISGAGRGLHGVVNNAGVAMIGPLIETDISELEWLFDVNVYGPYRITKAFAPLLLESKGRVVNISSISGVLSGPFLGHYSMSKHALEAYNDALANELGPLGVSVSAIEPGNFNSDIGETIRRRFEDGSFDLDKSLFKDRLKFMESGIEDRSRFKEPDAVADAAMHALFAEKPRPRYMVTPNQGNAEVTIRKAIQELVELNTGHEHSYSREQLLQMIEEELQRARLSESAAGE
jgi:NAD(P)-dependent dehydrogenase (short-subunit alcohol dehydrogenase family)